MLPVCLSGVSFASISFRYNEMDLLLGPSENQLDDYAEESLGSVRNAVVTHGI